MQASDIVNKYISYFEKRGHKRIANSPLVLPNDPTTLFTSSGMQALIPYLLGEPHAQGTRLVNVQNCIRTQDIEEVGNNRHTTFFRMMGNWSLGDYFKEDQLPWFFEFLTSKELGLGLDPKKLYVTVFSGDSNTKVKNEGGEVTALSEDLDAIRIWTKLFSKVKIEPKVIHNAEEAGMQGGRIFTYGVDKNWWSRAGEPSKMPAGEPGGPDAEVFYDFGTPHDSKYGKHCHPNCDCGRFIEIGNSVFMQYMKQEDGTFKELPKKNVDFGGGLERLAAAINNHPDVFTTDLYAAIIKEIEAATKKSYNDPSYQGAMRVIADHLKGATFLIINGVRPSNKDQGYILRRLLRRAAVKMHQLGGGLTPSSFFTIIDKGILPVEENIDEKIDRAENRDSIEEVLEEEMGKFAKSLDKGLKVLEKTDKVNAKVAFDLYQTFGFPVEITAELLAQKNQVIDLEEFMSEFVKHKELSKQAGAKKFAGGLADHQERTVMGHTATHLMHQAIRDMIGTKVHQSGSNITAERVRFDFNYDQKLTDEQIAELETVVNKKIKENLPVHFEMIPTADAKKMNAIGLFEDTYQDTSKIYFIGGDSKHPEKAYSIEFCGGPHVDFTSKVKSFKIIKQESLGKGFRRLYAVVG